MSRGGQSSHERLTLKVQRPFQQGGAHGVRHPFSLCRARSRAFRCKSSIRLDGTEGSGKHKGVDAAIATGATIDRMAALIRSESRACSRSAGGRYTKNLRVLIDGA